MALAFAVAVAGLAWIVLDRIHVATIEDVLDGELAWRVARSADQAVVQLQRRREQGLALADALARDARLAEFVSRIRLGASVSDRQWALPEIPLWVSADIQENYPDALAGVRLVERDVEVLASYRPLGWRSRFPDLMHDAAPVLETLDGSYLVADGYVFQSIGADLPVTEDGAKIAIEILLAVEPSALFPSAPGGHAARFAFVGRDGPVASELNWKELEQDYRYEVRDIGMGLSLLTAMRRAQMEELGQTLLTKERQQRSLGLGVVVLVFVVALVFVSNRIGEMLLRMSLFARRALDIHQHVPAGGNQLIKLEDWMHEFVRVVRKARDELRNELEAELRVTESLRDAVMNTSLDAIITVDRRGYILDFNPTAQAMFGYALADVKGTRLGEIMGTQSRLRVRDLLRLDFLSRGGESSEPRLVEDTIIDSQARVRPVELAIKPVTLENQLVFTVYLRDVAERKKRQEEIRSLANFPSENPNPVLRVNRLGVLVYGNAPSEPLLLHWGVRVGQTLPFYWKHKIQKVLEGGVNKEMEVSTDVGVFSMLLAPVADSGYVSIYARDITDIRQAELEVKQRQNELVHVSRLSTMGEMATGIAHELNQPLSAIVNFANGCIRRLRLDIGDKEDLQGALKQIADQAARASEIIKRLRGMIGRQQPVREVTDLNHLVRESSSLLAHDTRKIEVAIENRLSYKELVVRVDPVQIEQALLNLMRNALDALQEVPSASRRLIISSGVSGGGMAYVTVKDTAGGIPAEIKAHLFDAFFTTKETGMGMGLAISQTIVEDHNGNIFADSIPGKGTAFTIELPLYAESSESVAV